MSSSFLATGIFVTEAGQRFLYILLRFGERGFRALFDKCEGNTENRYYKEGLKRCSGWSDEVFNEDYEFVCDSCPDLEETYRSTFEKYTMDRFGTSRNVRCPSFKLFLKKFLISLSEHDCMRNGDYFGSRDPMISRLSCMDAARQTFYMIVTSEDKPDVELASEVGATRPYGRGDTGSKKPPSVVSSVRSGRRMAIREEGGMQQGGEDNVVEEEEDNYEVYPHDSASNVGQRKMAAQDRPTNPHSLPLFPSDAEGVGEEEYVVPSAPRGEGSAVRARMEMMAHPNLEGGASRDGSTVSRHDPAFDSLPSPPPTRPKSTVSSIAPSQKGGGGGGGGPHQQPQHRLRASSPESSVSVGMHHAHSPKR